MVTFSILEAERYRTKINGLAKSLTDEEAAYVPMMFERWKEGVSYKIGDRVCYEDLLYKVLIDHTSQSSWNPKDTPSLFARILIPDPSVIPDWEQPSSTNPYMMGDKVRHHEIIWISIINYNVYEPGVAGWEEYNE